MSKSFYKNIEERDASGRLVAVGGEWRESSATPRGLVTLWLLVALVGGFFTLAFMGRPSAGVQIATVWLTLMPIGGGLSLLLPRRHRSIVFAAGDDIKLPYGLPVRNDIKRLDISQADIANIEARQMSFAKGYFEVRLITQNGESVVFSYGLSDEDALEVTTRLTRALVALRSSLGEGRTAEAVVTLIR
ncbi:hypothetical protein [Devosia sp.]|uniref:hypothetical protein n=1 Tax=Devosia sp. TaxID=1871048 RepID=UPI003A95D772